MKFLSNILSVFCFRDIIQVIYFHKIKWLFCLQTSTFCCTFMNFCDFNKYYLLLRCNVGEIRYNKIFKGHKKYSVSETYWPPKWLTKFADWLIYFWLTNYKWVAFATKNVAKSKNVFFWLDRRICKQTDCRFELFMRCKTANWLTHWLTDRLTFVRQTRAKHLSGTVLFLFKSVRFPRLFCGLIYWT